jgi:hypothetical protein
MSRAWDEASRLRAVVMRDGLEVGRMKGLEIGPLANPIVARSDGDVVYVDQADTLSLRRTYADNETIDASRIVEVDAVWGQRTLAECLAGRTVDYAMASHVAEHVPDLVTWLAEVRSVLGPGGQLRLALRQETRLTDLVTAWILRARRPQVRDVLDFRMYTASGVDGGSVYAAGADVSHVTPDHSFLVAVQSAQAARDQPERYFDVHCLVAHAGSFAGLMAQLAERDLLQMACARMIDTAPPLFEFYAFMTPCDDRAAVLRSWREAQAACHDPLPGSAAARRSAADAERRLGQESLIAKLERDLVARGQALHALQRSASWRMTAPLRWVRSRLEPGGQARASSPRYQSR